MGARTAIYCRISEDREGAGLGVQRQEADCRKAAAARGWTVADVLVDNDLSAYSGKPRPAYRQLLAGLKAGDYDAVMVWHLDRLTRRPIELEEFFDTCDAAAVVDLASCTGDIDLSTHDGRFMARILGAAARKSSDDHSRRTARKHLELAEAGAPAGGGRPFGYESDRVTINAREAVLVREAAQRVLDGDSIRAIVVDWCEAGVTAPRGGRPTQTFLRRVLTNPRTAGKRSLRGEIVGEGQWEPVLDELTWRRVVAVIDARSTLGGGVGFGPRRYMLTGYLWCGKCGTRMIAQGRKVRERRRRTYICPANPDKGGCGGIRVSAEPLEDLVVVGALARLPALRANLRVAGDDVAEQRALDEIADLEQTLDRIAVDHYGGVISRSQFVASNARLTKNLDALRRAVTTSRRGQVLEQALTLDRESFGALPLDRQRAILDELVERVDVQPARAGTNTFDRERARVSWR